MLPGGLRRRGFGVWVLHLVNEGFVTFRKDALPRLNDAGAEATSAYVEAYPKNLREAVGKGPQNVDLFKELNAYGERFKMLARLPRYYTASRGRIW